MVKRFKVLFVTSWYPTEEHPVNGVFVREHAKAVCLYDDVMVLHLAGALRGLRRVWMMEEESDQALTEGIPTYRLFYRKVLVPKVSFFVGLWATLAAVRSIAAAGFRPDVIHTNVYDSAAAAVPVSMLLGIPVVATEHSTAFPRRLLGPVNTWVARFGYHFAKVVMPVSHDLRRSMEQHGIRARYTVVPNVVSTDLFHPADRSDRHGSARRLLFVGLLDPLHKKGVPYLFEALMLLQDEVPPLWHLDIVGDGPARPVYEEMAARLGLTDRVTFHGLKSKPEVAEFMRRADLFVLPSMWENLPCVLIEAMASGLPVVASKTGGVPEIVDQDTGVLVPPGDAPALAKGIADVLRSLDRYDHTVIAGRAQRYSPAEVGRTIHSVYEQALGIRPTASDAGDTERRRVAQDGKGQPFVGSSGRKP